jgi:CHASE2 domain-containing sensor protein
MSRLWIALEDQRVEQANAAFRKWAAMAGCVALSGILMWRGNTSDAAMNSVTVPLFCGITAMLLLLIALGVALQDGPETPSRPVKRPR